MFEDVYEGYLDVRVILGYIYRIKLRNTREKKAGNESFFVLIFKQLGLSGGDKRNIIPSEMNTFIQK